MGTHPIFESDFDCLTESDMGISRDSLHKRRATGGKRPQTRKKRAYELGRPSAMTRLMPHRVHLVRTRGGNTIPSVVRISLRHRLGQKEERQAHRGGRTSYQRQKNVHLPRKNMKSDKSLPQLLQI